ncbi:MAG: membrane-bound lytic murein transglycosylase D [Saprospiraceae bacterium]|jgi:membrane-bound lytic murein transglycosylase D
MQKISRPLSVLLPKSFLSLIFVFFFSNLSHAENRYEPLNDNVIKANLANLPCLVTKKDSPAVRSFLRTYLQSRREHAEVILGRTVVYFPMFERKLIEADMPTELKYLSIVESALKPKAVSRVGAGGLWQFMPATGEHYGLHISEHRDDRSDPEMATEGAIAYLKRQYKRFGNWELAIASYNSGPGRVNRAVKRARSKSFWKIQRYLPRETRAYVPGFIAATYLCHYYAEHGLTPQYPSLDMQMTKTVKIYDYLPFDKIQQLTGLSRYVIDDLNPAFNSGFVPASSQGYNVTLPKRVLQTVLDYLKHLKRPDAPQNNGYTISSVNINPKPVKLNTQDEYYKSVYFVQQDESLARIAEIFGVSKNSIMAWNSMNNEIVISGQELTLYHPNKIERWSPLLDEVSPPIESLDLQEFSIAPIFPNLSNPVAKRTKRTVKNKERVKKIKKEEDPTSIRGKYIMYRLQEGESLQDAADQFPGVRLDDILELNKIKEGKMPKAGTKIKIKKL